MPYMAAIFLNETPLWTWRPVFPIQGSSPNKAVQKGLLTSALFHELRTLSYMGAQSQGLKPARKASTLPLSTPQWPSLSYQKFENQYLKLPSRRLNFLIVIIRFLIPITLVKHGLCILSFLNFLPSYFDLVCDTCIISFMNADKYIF